MVAYDRPLVTDLAHGTGETTETSDVVVPVPPSRAMLARHLLGSGVELGPGHVPFRVGHGTVVRFVDRWEPDENQALFPELEGAAFPMPDIVADLNTDRLRALADQSQDFVIASHVLEHMAEPIGLLADIHRVLRPGGVAVVLLPDRHRTFDRYREATSLAHLVAEHQAGVTEIDDAHLAEYMEKTGLWKGVAPSERAARLDLELRRSIHVHCWADEEFFPVLLHGIEHLRQRWEFVDGTLSDDEGPDGIEFGFVLRRSHVDGSSVPSPVLAERLNDAWHSWREARLAEVHALRAARSEANHLNRELAELRPRITELEVAVAERQQHLDAIGRRFPVRIYRLTRRILRRG